MVTHELKTHPEFFKETVKGFKTFEIRKNDRNFQLGDTLLLKEYNPKTKKYSNKKILVRITYMLNDKFKGISKGYCLMSIIPVKKNRMTVYTKSGEVIYD